MGSASFAPLSFRASDHLAVYLPIHGVSLTRFCLPPRRGDILPSAIALLASLLSRIALLVISGPSRLRTAHPGHACRACLREYSGPLALVAPLALALVLAMPPAAAGGKPEVGARAVSAVVPKVTSPSDVPGVRGGANANVSEVMTAGASPEKGELPGGEGRLTPTLSQGESEKGGAGLQEKEQSAVAGEKAKTPFAYRVAAGDTAGGIAERFGVSLDTVLSANAISNPGALQIGQELTILPVSGVVHTVEQNDTLVEIAALYGVSAESITEYNALPSQDSLQIGAALVVPDGKMEIMRSALSTRGGTRPAAPTGSLQWPVVGGISTYFNGGHRGLDIMAGMGVPVYAADGGTVVTAIKGAYDYGHYLVVDHGNGLRTLYSHLSAFYVDSGDKVSKGEKIGAIGTTGLSTGPHLHLELWKNGSKIDPLDYLP